MSTIYTGVGANVSQSTSPTATIPVDGDARNALSVDSALQKLVDYVALIWAGVFTGTGAGPGLSGIGGATGPGLKATAGGGASPAAGALQLVTQNTPSAPADGQAWYDGTNFVGRIGGATKNFVLGILTRALLPAVGQQISSSCGGFSNSGAVLVDVTNLSVTLTTTGRPVMVFLIPDGAGNAGVQSSANAGAVVVLDRGGATIASWLAWTANAVIANSQLMGSGGPVYLDAVAAGTYTWKIRINPQSAAMSVNNYKLVAYEL